MARVQFDNVRKVYANGVEAVRGASFSVEDGEFVVFVGPSGCGKTTLLRMVAGLEEITSGDLSIGDRVVNDVAPMHRDVAMVFQNYALYPHMSVYDNMAFGLRRRKVPKAEVDRRVREAAAILGIESMLDRKPKLLSGGQRQRVAVGRAIVRNPAVFLFDEPLSNLDAKLRVQTRTEISKLHRRLGATMIYVTHDQVEAMTMGDRIVVLEDGAVQQIDTPLNLYNHPVNRFVAGFIGSPGMNFLDGEIAETEGHSLIFRTGDGLTLPIPAPLASTLQGTGRRRVTLGIRPEALALALPTADPAAVSRWEIDVVEPMGNEVVLYAHRGAAEVVARVGPQAIPDPGSPADLAFDIDQMHVFDAASGASLSASAGTSAPAGPLAG